MNILFHILAILILSIIVVNAETNGIWHNAEDIRPGEFASDEGGGDFRFPQNVDINNNLGVGTNSIISGNPAQNSYIIGNFGVGDTTPLNQLSVESTAGNVVIGITSNGLTYSSIDFYNGANNKWGIGKDSSDNFYIDEFGVANRLSVIQGTGYVGINTYTPRAELEVDGDIIAKNIKLSNGTNVSSLDDVYVNEDQPNSITSPMIVDGTIIANDISSNYYLWNRYGNDVTTNLAGNVGIGTTNPAAKLHIVNDGAGAELLLDAPSGDVSGIRFAIDGSDKFFIGGAEDALMLGKIDPAVSNMATIFLTNLRDVGIGTASPQAKLHVTGNIIANNPTQNNHVATKQYVDEQKYVQGALYSDMNWDGVSFCKGGDGLPVYGPGECISGSPCCERGFKRTKTGVFSPWHHYNCMYVAPGFVYNDAGSACQAAGYND